MRHYSAIFQEKGDKPVIGVEEGQGEGVYSTMLDEIFYNKSYTKWKSTEKYEEDAVLFQVGRGTVA